MILHVPRPLVLASTSQYRRHLLKCLGIPFEAVSPAYEEEHDLELPPEKLVVVLAERKARSVGTRYPRSLIIGSDQVAELDGNILLKPGTVTRARQQLEALAGRTHRLLTGVVVYEPASDRIETALDIHHMTVRPLSEEQIAAYVARERPLDCAGSYRIEGPGVALFASMKGTDYTGIVGLPLTRLVDLLIRFGAY
jgi:septum formation protein